jgi:hypothetical protein
LSALRVLAAEALRDASRRRIVAAVVAVSVLSLLGIDSCTSCATGEVMVNGEPRKLAELAGYTGAATFVVLGLWCVVLAGVLCAEHLAQTIEDGTAPLVLARPVSRDVFAGARLAGALAIAGVTAAVLLGATALFLHARGQLPLVPPLIAGAAAGLGGVCVGALAMAVSLALPRLACILLVLAFVATTSLANLVGLATAASGGTSGLLGLVDRLGPPLLTSMALALGDWMPGLAIPGDALSVGAKLAAWAAGSLVLLGAAFRRFEIGGS